MRQNNDLNSLHIVDTSKCLTEDELKELKDLAQMSKTAKVLFAIAMAFIAVFGIDKLIQLLKGHI